MKYWIIKSDDITNFTIIKCEEEPETREITETEYHNYEHWLKEYKI